MERKCMCCKMEVKPVKIEYDEEIKYLSISIGNRGENISIRDIESMEKLLKLLDIPYEEKLGNMLGDVEFLQYQYENDSLYKLGYEAGKKTD